MSIWFQDYTLDDLNKDRGLTKDHINKHLGIIITEIGEDFLKGTMPVDHRTVQPFGILHGGASCVLAETLGSVASWMCIDFHKFMAVGIELNASHLRSISSGEVTGICKPVRVGRGMHVWQIDLFNPEGKMTCTTRLTCAVKDRPKS